MHDGQLPPPGTRRLITGEGPQRNGQQACYGRGGPERQAGTVRTHHQPQPSHPGGGGREGGERSPPVSHPHHSLRAPLEVTERRGAWLECS